MNWNLSQAKNKLSEVLDRARRDGPQTISRRGDSFILLPADQYQQLTGKAPRFNDWLLNGLAIDDLPLPKRNTSSMRKPKL
jgi:antitoxin Phd